MTEEEFNAPPTDKEIASHRNVMKMTDVVMRRLVGEYSDEQVVESLTATLPDTGGTLLNGSRTLRILLEAYKEAHG